MGTSADQFAELFERDARAVYNYCFRRTGDWALAEDLTSTVFLEAWRRREIALDELPSRAWLLGVATNVLRNQRRSLRRYAAALSRLPVGTNEPDFSEDLTVRLDAEQQMRDALVVFRRLPRAQQDVIALSIWADLTYEETALALNVPVGTVRSRLARARLRIEELTRATSAPTGPLPNRGA